MPTKPTSLPTDLLELQVFGSGVVRLGNQELKFATRKLLALLTYLVLEGETSRSKLSDLFWSDNSEDDARRNLRRELHRLRELGLRDRLESSEDHLRLVGRISSDVNNFEQLVQAGDLEAALTLFTTELLEGLKLEGATGFETWLELKRASLARLRRQVRLELAGRFETERDYQAALNLNLQLLEEDPLHERLHREVMRLQYLLGMREAALTQFEQCKIMLHQELGLEPLPETLQLEAQIRAAASLENKVNTLPVVAQGWVIPLIGRESLLAQLASSQARFKLVLGEAGVGKTRLLDEFASGGLRIQFKQISSQIPFYAVAQSIRNCMSSIENQARFAELEVVWQREAAKLVPELHNQKQNAKSSAEDQTRFLEGLARTLECLSPNKLIVFDDLHWADNSSLALIAHLLHRSGQAVQLLASAREHELNASVQTLLDNLEKDKLLQTIQVLALDELSTLELVQVLSGRLAPLFASRLYKATAGNPFFLLETIRYLFEQNELEIQDGFWVSKYDDTTTNYLELPIPPSVRGAVLERVDKLGSATRRLLETAALTLDGFKLQEIQPATALNEWESLDGLEQAVAAKLLRQLEVGYGFSHDLTRSALESGLGTERRKLIHVKLASSLEQQQASAARIAWHLESAALSEQAVPWRVKAAQEASQIYAYETALEQYAQAVQHEKNLVQAFEIRLEMLHLYQNVNQPEQWLRTLEDLETIAIKLEQPNYRIQAALEKSLYLIWNVFDQEALEVSEWVLQQADSSDQQRAQALEDKGYVLANLGKLEESDLARQQAIDLLGRKPSSLRGKALYGQLMNAYKRGDYQVALQIAARCHQELLAVQAKGFLINLFIMEGVLFAMTGAFSSAIASLEQARAQAKELRHPYRWTAALFNLFELYLEQGNIETARTVLLEVSQAAPNIANPFELAAYKRYQSQLAWFEGKLGTGIQLAQQALELDEVANAMEHRLLGRLTLAGLYLELNALELALPLLEETKTLIATSSLGLFSFTHGLRFAQLALCKNQPEQSLKHLNTLEELTSTARPDDLAWRDLLRVQAHLQQNQKQTATALLERVPENLNLENRLRKIILQVRLQPSKATLKNARIILEKPIPALFALELQRVLGLDVTKELKQLSDSLEGFEQVRKHWLERQK